MQKEWKSRTRLMAGEAGMAKLEQANVLVVGLGGVGACAAEMICRAGVGRMTLVDGDAVDHSNINRQLIALTSTLHSRKTEALAARLRDINPEIELTLVDEFLRDERMIELLDSQKYDYVVDAIDTLSPKTFLIVHTLRKGYPLVSSMGAGGKWDPTRLVITDISKTYQCKLARMIRKRLHKLGVHKGFKAVFSSEEVNEETFVVTDGIQNKKTTVGTISYMPAAFGLACASVVIRALSGHEEVKED